MNTYIKAQITQMQTTVKVFLQACELGALKDDGTIDRDERKMLDRINKASERFIKELDAASR